jgi:hypothetical protein
MFFGGCVSVGNLETLSIGVDIHLGKASISLAKEQKKGVNSPIYYANKSEKNCVIWLNR